MDGGIGRGCAAALGLALAWAGACDGDDTGDDAAGTTTVATTSGPSTDADTGSGSSGLADSTTGEAVPMGPPKCTKTCIVPGECCPPGVEGCPSSDYPNNWTCVDDLCVDPQCASDAECGGGACLTIFGLNSCATPCSEDGDCAVISDIAACAGMADDGQGFCIEPCTEQSITCGNAVCDEPSGLCSCTSDTQCPFDDRCV